MKTLMEVKPLHPATVALESDLSYPLAFNHASRSDYSESEALYLGSEGSSTGY
jgi:hypothetical protein